jgi:phosphatidylcholine synthase
MNKRGRKITIPKAKIHWLLAWCVHFYTALGLLAASGIAVLIVRGGTDSFRWAFVLMVVAVLIDATDGALARRLRVKEILPGFDGRRLDDLTDFLNYTCLPLLLLWRAEILPAGLAWCLLIPILASAYGFCQVSAKTSDGYFLGFPSYWNVVAFYLYILQPPTWFSLTVIVVLALLTFVPSRYLYPTQRGKLNRFTNLLGTLWAGFPVWILITLPPDSASGESPQVQLAWLSLFFPLYYLLVSWAITLRLWRNRRLRPDAAGVAGALAEPVSPGGTA